MSLAQCVWCGRYRIVRLRSWRSPKTGGWLCGDVCGHCYDGTGSWDDCRTCRAKKERGVRVGRQTGVRPLTQWEALELMRQQGARGKREA